MLLDEMTKEDLELLSFTDLTALILKEKNKPLNTPTIFKKICSLLEFTDEQYAEKIGDYYTSLTTDKRFIFLATNEWDLKAKHPVNIILDDDEDEEEIEEEEEEIEEEVEDDIDDVIEDEELDDDNEELEDLSILTEEELEEN
ncbi:MAG: DNA-directed RNA polymerase subunit delta [Bacilli bacterium]